MLAVPLTYCHTSYSVHALMRHTQGSHSNHFLAGRALWAAAKLCKLMSSEQVDVFLSAAAAGRSRGGLALLAVVVVQVSAPGGL
jgi:hypothetical protein